MTLKRVWFQKTRLTLFVMKYAFLGGKAQDAALKATYKEMSELGLAALRALQIHCPEAFIQMLDGREAEQSGDELSAMINGYHPDLPSWLKK